MNDLRLVMLQGFEERTNGFQVLRFAGRSFDDEFGGAASKT